MSGNPSPPGIARAMLRRAAPPSDTAFVVGDLDEEFAQRADTHGVRAARRWYRRQVLASLSPLLARRLFTVHPSAGGVRMMAPDRLFGPVMFWTVTTTVFAWLPLARIIGRPENYHWGILGLSGSGTRGPFWIFAILTAYAVTMLWLAFRGSRPVFRFMLIAWHLAVTGTVIAGTVLGGASATWQGQGLHWEVPLWLAAVPCAAFTVLTIVWCVLDSRHGSPRVPTPWSRRNTARLAASLGILAVSLLMFAAGTNYNWVTAVAIVLAVIHWIVLVRSFEPVPPTASIGAGLGDRASQSRPERPPRSPGALSVIH